ncbi:hypothetical protein PCK2_000730 [Pneumocystis canis]|nr:hypothetical protein PCK2_000730 [Pneumocystis canis]
MSTIVTHLSRIRKETSDLHTMSKHTSVLDGASPWPGLLQKTSSLSAITSLAVSSTRDNTIEFSQSLHTMRFPQESNMFISSIDHQRSFSLDEETGSVSGDLPDLVESFDDLSFYPLSNANLIHLPPLRHRRDASTFFRPHRDRLNTNGLSNSLPPKEKVVYDFCPALPASVKHETSESIDSAYGDSPDISSHTCAELGSGLKSKFFRNRSLSLGIQQFISREGITKLKERYIYRNTHHGFRKKDIGSGATATVQVVSLKPGCHSSIESTGGDSGLFAVKTFRKKSRSERKEDYLKKLASEWTIQRRVDHPNVVRAVDLCLDDHALSADSWFHDLMKT